MADLTKVLEDIISKSCNKLDKNIENLENISTRLSILQRQTTDLKKEQNELIEKHRLLEHRLNKLEKYCNGKTPLGGVFPTKQEKIVIPSQVDEYLDKFEYSTEYIKERTKNLYKYSYSKTEKNLNTSYLICVIQTIFGKYLIKNKQEKMLYLTKDLDIMYDTNIGLILIGYTFDIDLEYFKKLFINYLRKYNIPYKQGGFCKMTKEQLKKLHYDTNGETDINTKD